MTEGHLADRTSRLNRAARLGAMAAVLWLATGESPLLAQAALPANPAQPPASPETKPHSLIESCIPLSVVRRSEIVDDRTILFYLRNGHIKKVTLAFPCPSLKFYGSFSYEVYSNRLCARVDTIVSRAGTHCPIGDIADLPPSP